MTRKVKRMNILEEANEIVSGDRNKTYGDPADNHLATARLWTVYIIERKHAMQVAQGKGECEPMIFKITEADVCFLNILQKIARTIHGETTHDTLVDIAGYARNIEILQDKDEEPTMIEEF